MSLPTAGSIRFFLGANSKNGFASLYDEFAQNPAAGDFVWVLKGGPGCGKSSFMRRIGTAAEEAGFSVEYILCSGDPDSLDAVRIPEKRIVYVDGTAPHVTEAVCPGAASLYLDLGSFLDAGALEPHLPEILALNRQISAAYAAAYARLAASAALLRRNRAGLWGPEAEAALDRKLAGLAVRELPKRPGRGTLTRRFLSANSCRGRLFLAETAAALCPRLWLLDNGLGLAHVYLEKLAALARERGYDVLLCPDPLEPELPEAVLLPDAGIGFLAADRKALPEGLPVWRHLRLDTLAAPLAPDARTKLRQMRRESAALYAAAVDSLAEAKSLHDALEAVYHPHVDFAGVSALAEDHVRWLLGQN